MLFFPLVSTAQHSCWTSSYNISSFLGPFYSLGIFGPFHFLGILGPFHSFLLLTFPWAFAKSFGLPWPNYHILYPWVYWPSNQSHLLISFFGLLQPLFTFFLFLTILMGLLLHHLGLPWPVCSLWEPLYYFVGLWTIIPAILAQWSLLYLFLSPPFSYCWASFTIKPVCQKWASTGFKLHML